MIVVGTWNLENLFKPNSEYGPSPAVYEEKLDGLATVIKASAPDVLAVQEVGDPEALEDLVARLEGDWHTALSTVFDEHHPIRVGIISKLSIDEVEDVSALPAELVPIRVRDHAALSPQSAPTPGSANGTGEPKEVITKMRRGALRARVRVGSENLDVVVCHLKSKLLSYPGGRFEPRDEGERARYAGYALDERTAEAVAVREYENQVLAGEGKKRASIVLGDCNDEAAAATTQILLGPPGSEINTPGYDRPDKGDAWRLWNLAPLIQQASDSESEHRPAFSRISNDQPELIDHILVSHRVLRDGLPTIAVGDVPVESVSATPSARKDKPLSDHRPLFTRLAL